MTESYEKQDFWDNKSRTYPAFEKDAYDTVAMLEFFAANGVNLRGEWLEVGCGTGRFTLQLAFVAKSVLGVDFSGGMLAKLTQRAHELNLKNVRTQNVSWQDFCAHDTRVFDAVFAAMTPALDSADAVREVARRTQRHFCYVGWGESRSDIYTAVYALQGIAKPCIMPSARFVELAREAGFRLINRGEFLRDKYYTDTPAQALADFRAQIERQGVVADEAKLAEFVARHTSFYAANDEAVKEAMRSGLGASAACESGEKNASAENLNLQNSGEKSLNSRNENLQNSAQNLTAQNITTQDFAAQNKNAKNLNSQNKNEQILVQNSKQNSAQNLADKNANSSAPNTDKIELFRYPYKRVNVAMLFEKI